MSTVWRKEKGQAESDHASRLIDQAIAGFTELWDYRNGLVSIAQQIEQVKTHCLRLEVSGAEDCFRMVREQAGHLDVPRGCESAQRALVFAMKSYDAALQSLRRGVKTGHPFGLGEAQGYIHDGDVLLSSAIQLTRKV